MRKYSKKRFTKKRGRKSYSKRSSYGTTSKYRRLMKAGRRR